MTRGHAIEALARANHFVFDKTGNTDHRPHAPVAEYAAGVLDAQACIDLGGDAGNSRRSIPGAIPAGCGELSGDGIWTCAAYRARRCGMVDGRSCALGRPGVGG